jgi:hypothetical protein
MLGTAEPSGALAPVGESPPPSASPPDSAGLEFPPPREPPIGLADDPTPEEVIDAFHRLVHDADLAYRAEGRARWVFEGTELLTSTRIARSPVGMHYISTFADGTTGEAILVGGSAAGRLGGGAWEATDAELVRLFDDLASALVVGDLGREPIGAGYRLVLERGFDGFPQAVPFLNTRSITEIVVDDEGRPLSAISHRWTPSAEEGDGATEGLAVYTISDVGAPVEIPPFPLEPDDEAPVTPGPLPMAPTALPAGDLSVEMPQSTAEGRTTVTLYDGAGDAQPVTLDTIDATVGTARFEVATAVLPPLGLGADELLEAMRLMVVSHTPGGDLLGFRAVTVAEASGQEFVAGGYDEQRQSNLHRVRTVVIGDRLVVLKVVGPPAVVGSPEADRFLASLALTEGR